MDGHCCGLVRLYPTHVRDRDLRLCNPMASCQPIHHRHQERRMRPGLHHQFHNRQVHRNSVTRLLHYMMHCLPSCCYSHLHKRRRKQLMMSVRAVPSCHLLFWIIVRSWNQYRPLDNWLRVHLECHPECRPTMKLEIDVAAPKEHGLQRGNLNVIEKAAGKKQLEEMQIVASTVASVCLNSPSRRQHYLVVLEIAACAPPSSRMASCQEEHFRSK
mmetsp:Transcript_104308/g.162594  ORF Transcript_104308/g.162594 Transcript_104308/m.162594 type:complete len:215 (+) Transcript_104308:1389-2033(+)